MRVLLSSAVLFAIPVIGSAGTIYVPDDHATIQAAIVAAVDDDVVIVRPGTYFENIDLLGKAITLRSEHGPVVTSIDGNQAGTVVSFQSGEGPSTILQGFTITNGLATQSAGGILCDASSPTILGNVVEWNTVLSTYSQGGAGILCIGASPRLFDNIIQYNETHGQCPGQWPCNGPGGGISVWGGAPTIMGNLVLHNWGGREGGGLYLDNCSVLLRNNLIAWNAASFGGGIYANTATIDASLNTL